MNQLIAIATGGAAGALLRFFVSSGVYRWLGRGFPYGTLAVNLIGSYLIGLFAEGLLLRGPGSSILPYRAAILTGFMGSLTTFSTFSLETVYLMEQGNPLRACANIVLSVALGLLAAWGGLLSGRLLFFEADVVVPWFGWLLPFLVVNFINAIGAFLLGVLTEAFCQMVTLSLEVRTTLLVLLAGTVATFSSLYLLVHLIQEGYAFKQELHVLLTVFGANAVLCTAAVWGGFSAARRI